LQVAFDKLAGAIDNPQIPANLDFLPTSWGRGSCRDRPRSAGCRSSTSRSSGLAAGIDPQHFRSEVSLRRSGHVLTCDPLPFADCAEKHCGYCHDPDAAKDDQQAARMVAQ
jgi:hypothetical protein